MHVLHINSDKDAHKVDKLITHGNNVFILVYMEGCGPCNATRPEWAKIESALKDQYSKNNKLVVIDINKDFLKDVKHIGDIDGFPTMKYIGNNGKQIESYENSSINNKDRTIDSFINWIESKINTVVSTTPTSSPQNVFNRLTNKNKGKGRGISKSKRNNKKHKLQKGGKSQKSSKLRTNRKKTRRSQIIGLNNLTN